MATSPKPVVRWWSVAIFLLAMFPIYWGTAYVVSPANMLVVIALYFGADLVSVALAMAPYGRAAFDLLGLRPAGWRLVLAGTAGSLILSLAVSPLGEDSEWVQEVIELVREPGQLLACLVLIGGLGPLAEELVFRGLFYGWIEGRWGPRVAVVVSALAFAAAHLEPVYIAMTLPAGLFLGLLRWRSNSLVTPLIAHATNNCAFVLATKYFDL